MAMHFTKLGDGVAMELMEDASAQPGGGIGDGGGMLGGCGSGGTEGGLPSQNSSAGRE